MDTLSVSDYWSTFDYLALKYLEKQKKAKTRDRSPGHTPSSKYLSAETAYLIAQFKSPREQIQAPIAPGSSVPTL